MKTKLLFALIALAAAGSSVGVAQTGIGKLFKKETKTKTSDDGAGSKLAPVKGVKHAIGVSDFTNEAQYHRWSELGGNLKYMLESALGESGRFVMVERINLGTVIAEQDLAQSGRTAAAKTVAETGKLRSARYVATGAVTEISESTSGETGGFAIKGIRLGGASAKSSVVIVVKLVDTTTGEQVATKRIRGEAGKNNMTVGIDRGGGSGNIGAFAKTPLGEAAQDCINEAVKFIAESMKKTTIESMVVAVTKDEVVIAMGENYGVEVGQKLLVRKDGEILKNEDTGEILDRLEGEITGTIEIVRVREKSAYCKVVEGKMPVKNDRVVVK